MNDEFSFRALRCLDKSQEPADEREHKRLRDALIGNYVPLVETLARCSLKTLGLVESNDFDDLKSEGYLSLVEAVGSFDPERGVAFETYVTHKINGRLRTFARDRAGVFHRRGGGPVLDCGFDADDVEDENAFDFAEDFAENEGLRQIVESAIERLERSLSTNRERDAWARQKQALQMRFWSEKSLLAVALDMSISPDAAKKLIGRALERLKPYLEREFAG